MRLQTKDGRTSLCDMMYSGSPTALLCRLSFAEITLYDGQVQLASSSCTSEGEMAVRPTALVLNRLATPSKGLTPLAVYCNNIFYFDYYLQTLIVLSYLNVGQQ